MKNSKKLAVYLDHSQATLFDFGLSPIEFKTISSDFDNQDKKEILQKGESHLHNKEQHLQNKYHENLGEAILDFNNVLLFGPTDAKTELFNYLTDNRKFGKIQIKVKTSDKLTENQQLAFINNYFSGTI
jgi:stalled ribosome rescue protein Dom34